MLITMTTLLSAGGDIAASSGSAAAAATVVASATAVAAVVGLSYWSSSTTSTYSSVGTVLLFVLRATGCDVKDDDDDDEQEEEEHQHDQPQSKKRKKEDDDAHNNLNTTRSKDPEYCNSYRQKESQFVATYLNQNHDNTKKKDDSNYSTTYDATFSSAALLQHPNKNGSRIISDTIRNAALLPQQAVLASAVLPEKEQEEESGKKDPAETFHQAFQILRNALHETTKREPHLRDQYFHGSTTTPSTNATLEDEDDIEQMLRYLRCIEFLQKEAVNDDDATYTKSMIHTENGSGRRRQQQQHHRGCFSLPSLPSLSSSSFSSVESAATSSTTSSVSSSASRWRLQPRPHSRRRRFHHLLRQQGRPQHPATALLSSSSSSAYGYADYELLHCCVDVAKNPTTDGSSGSSNSSSSSSTLNDNEYATTTTTTTTTTTPQHDGDDRTAAMNANLMSHLVSIHRHRKEIILAVNYPNDTVDDTTTNSGSATYTAATTSSTQNEALLLQSFTDYLLWYLHTTTTNTDTAAAVVPPPAVVVNHHYQTDDDCPSSLESSVTSSVSSSSSSASVSSASLISLLTTAGYTLIVCGHGRGAAVACRIGIALRHKIRRHSNGFASSIGPTTDSSSTVRVYAYGLPPVTVPIADKKNQNAMEDDEDEDDVAQYASIITSIVNNHDCIPRLTVSNLHIFQQLLVWTTERKTAYLRKYFRNNYQHPQHSHRIVPPPAFAVSSTEFKRFWIDIQQAQAQEQSEQGIVNTTPATITTTIRSTTSTITAASSIKYINPGKIISIWNTTQDANIIGTQIIEQRQQHRRRYNTVSTTTTTGRGPILWVDDTMLLDHTLDSYRANLELLLEQAANTI